LLSDWVNKNQVPLLTGFAEFEFIPFGQTPPRWSKYFESDTAQHYMTYNACVLVESGKTYSENNKPQTYRKSKLTPFGEYFPFKDVFPYLAEKLLWSVGISNWNIGTGADILKLKVNGNQAKIGNIICIESIHPNFVRNYILKGANILTVITNDAWYDNTPGPRQHYLLSCIRAIENRRYIARVGNTGVSGFISPLGYSLDEVPQYTQSAKAMTLPLLEEKTIYSLWGDWLAWIISGIAGLFVILSFVKKKTTE
jgi:apolipoprotein N-acyltransferase